MHHNWFFPSRAADPWTNVFDPRGCIEAHTELSVKTPKQRSFTANGLPLQWTTHHQHIDALWRRIPCQYIQCIFPLKPFDVIPIPFDASLHAFIWWSLCFPWKPPQEKCRKPWTFFSVEKLHKNPQQPPFGCTNLINYQPQLVFITRYYPYISFHVGFSLQVKSVNSTYSPIVVSDTRATWMQWCNAGLWSLMTIFMLLRPCGGWNLEDGQVTMAFCYVFFIFIPFHIET